MGPLVHRNSNDLMSTEKRGDRGLEVCMSIVMSIVHANSKASAYTQVGVCFEAFTAKGLWIS